jgi:S-(hydroxymethyl)glutathione dehydrogenase/alcohol dehydrogenase
MARRDIDAAVLRGPRDLHYESVLLDDPKDDEVLVDVRTTGVCHTDFHAYTNGRDCPVVLGHEGSGVVEQIGKNVTTVEPGDHVVLFVLPTSDDCSYTRRGQPYLSQVRKQINGGLLDGTRRLHDEEGTLNHFYAQSSFATKAVVPERTAIPIRKDVPFDVASLLACGATTGIGGVVNTADVKSGETVAVLGCGGVGLSTLMGAKAVSAGTIIGIDVVDSKLDAAQTFGATHTVNGETDDPVARIKEITGDGVDYAFECIGASTTVQQAFQMLSPGGTAVITGTSSTGTVEIDAGRFTSGVSVVGNIVGSARPSVDIPRYLEMYVNGDVPLEDLITNHYSLDQLHEAFAAMEHGETLRSVIVLEE